jgi:hypothetical protein
MFLAYIRLIFRGSFVEITTAILLLINSHQQMHQNKFALISLLKDLPNTHFRTSILPSSGGS